MFDVIELAETCPSARAFEDEILSGLEREIGCDAAFFWSKGDVPTLRGFDAEGQRTLLRMAIDEPARYETELEPIKAAAMAAGGVAVDTEVLGEQAVRQTRYFRELAAPLGGRHSLLACLSLRGEVVAGLMLGRGGSAFRLRDRDHVRSMLGVIAMARASFGLPCRRLAVSDPLPATPAPRGFWRRLCEHGSSRVLASVPTAWGEISVRDRNGYREMVAVQGTSEMVWTRTKVDEPCRSGWPYIELFHVAAGLAGQCRNSLFIGCGGAVALRQFARRYPDMAMDLVESEPTVIELARSWYALDRIPDLTVHIADGAAFVASGPAERWDVIVVDAYGAGDLAAGFSASSFFASVRRALRPGGVVAFNVVGTLGGQSAVQEVVGAARQELSDVRLLPVVEAQETALPWTLRNVVVVASRPARISLA